MEANQKLDTPVLFLIFNRPDVTEKVLGQIKKVQPRQLFIAADGPRVTHPDDLEKCKKTRELVLSMLDWDCEVKTLFRDKNLGCGLAVSQAITWFFEHVEMGIILEDDCYPDLSFFRFCMDMLEYYKEDERVMHINGSNFQLGKWHGKSKYYFSSFPNSWGWATWAERWAKYDFMISDKVILKKKSHIFHNSFYDYWQNILRELKNNLIDTWDYQWYLAVYLTNALCVTPNRCLIKNLGIAGTDSTHTHSFSGFYNGCHLGSLTPPYTKKRDKVFVNRSADSFQYKKFLNPNTTFLNHLRNLFYKVISFDRWQAIKHSIKSKLMVTPSQL